MADNEDETSNGAAAGGGDQTHVSVAVGGNREGCGVTVSGEDQPGLTELVHSVAAKGVDGSGCQEVLGHILGAEVLTSFIEAPVRDGVQATVGGEFLNALTPTTTTIIYVQPDGSFVESSGLTAEEHQQLIEQLSKQQLVQVTGNEEVHIFEQPHTSKPATAIPSAATFTAAPSAVLSATPSAAPSAVLSATPSAAPSAPLSAIPATVSATTVSVPVVSATPFSSSATTISSPSHTVKTATIAPLDVQQVIDHVNKSQVATAGSPRIPVPAQPTSYITLEQSSVISGTQLTTTTIQPQPFTIVHNAAQQLQSAAKQVALQQSQNGAHLIQPKPAEPIHIQVQATPKQEIKPRQAAPITIVQPQSLPVNQPLVKVSTVSSPQIIHITPVPGQQQYYLQNPGEPPIQLLLQKSAPVASSISVPIVHKVQAPTPPTPSISKPLPNPASNPPSIPSSSPAFTENPAAKPVVVASPSKAILAAAPSTSVSSPTTKILTPPGKVTTVVTNVSTPAIEKEKPKMKNRQKKSQRIQTRSGRVSRPPKHKAKDFKFIKNEDLAEGHQSDSDDYSEISVEDQEGEENQKKKTSYNYTLRRKAFSCEMCDKSYIGMAGLNRHYRLNPSHDKNQTCPSAGKDSKLSERRAATNQKVQADTSKAIEKRRPGRPKGSGRVSLLKRPGRKPKRRGRGRPPKYLTTATVEQQEQRRRIRLTEFIRQYDDEDLMEIVLPRLAKVMTVWEFVMMKVEKGHPSKQQFPSVYHEFEQLHSQVKKMAQEHFSIAPASRPALQVNNMEVLKSLGIADLPSTLTLLNSTQGQQCSSRVNQTMKSLRSIENTKMLPPAKRFKMENCVGENNNSAVNKNDVQKDEARDGSTLLREPQVVLTRLEDCNSETVVDDGALPSSEEVLGAKTEEEPMDTGDGPLDFQANKLDTNKEVSDGLNMKGTVDVTDQMKQLEQALCSDTEHERGPQKTTPQDTSCEPPVTGSLGEEGTVGEPAASRVVESAQAEEVFIQTAEGLVRQSAEELASKGIVIVNGPDGTTMHIEAPEGVPLETVHALLGIETEDKT